MTIAKEAALSLRFDFPYDADDWYDSGMPMENYHKHTTWSNIFQMDSATSLEEFAALNHERGAKLLFSGEHGYQGEWLYVYDFCKKHPDAKFRYSTEAYWVKDRHEKDNTNCHIVLVARNYAAVRKLNFIISVANSEGFYYKPRIDLELLFSLSPEDVYVTTACVAGWKYEDAEDIWLKIANHFGDSFFLEYQCHNTSRQKDLNKRIQRLAKKYNLQTIVGLDTHYINEEDRIKRENLLVRKGISYPDEEGWYMDYPTGREVFERLKQQGILSNFEILQSMMNTHVFVAGCEEIEIPTNFKIPILPQYQGLSYDERVDELKKILNTRYRLETDKSPERVEGLRYEVGEIADSGIVDYFLDDYHIIQLATSPEYGGHLTTTGRGSAGSYYTNKILGLTTIDRFNAEVPVFPERFMTKDRIEASHQCADADLNCSEAEPFIKASKDLLGEHSCYPLLAVGKLKEKSAFKLYAGVNNVDPQVANDVTTRIDQYNEALKNVEDDDKDSVDIADYINDRTLYALYKESLPYQNIVEQAKVHACGNLLFNGDPTCKDVIGYGDIRYEIGLIRCVSESTKNSVLVACVEGSLLDPYGYVKNDYLIVDVVSIIHKLYESIGMQVPPVSQLREMVSGDAATWDLYAKGITCCLNQCEKQATTQRIMRYKPQNVKELSAFIAGIRPGFKSLLDGFLDRVSYTSGEDQIDELLKDSFHYMLYQEATMKLFQYLGIPMKDAYDTIKKISKKKLVGEALAKVEATLKEHWLSNIGNLDNFAAVYQVIKDSARYQFNAIHALSMAFDSLYEAWVKAHYTSKFYEVVLNHYLGKGDKIKVAALLKEAKECFGYTIGAYHYGLDHSHFTVDDSEKIIYPSLASIKGIGEQAAEELKEMSARHYDSLCDIMLATKGSHINKTVLTSLAKLQYFSSFGTVKEVMLQMETFWYWTSGDGKKRISKTSVEEFGLDPSEVAQYATDQLASGNISKTQYTIKDLDGLVRLLMAHVPKGEYSVPELAQMQYAVLGDVLVTDSTLDKRFIVVTELDDKYSPKLTAYCLATGEKHEIKIHKKKDGRNKCIKSAFHDTPFRDGAVLFLNKCSHQPKSKKLNGKWVKVPGTIEWWADWYTVVRDVEGS